MTKTLVSTVLLTILCLNFASAQTERETWHSALQEVMDATKPLPAGWSSEEIEPSYRPSESLIRREQLTSPDGVLVRVSYGIFQADSEARQYLIDTDDSGIDVNDGLNDLFTKSPLGYGVARGPWIVLLDNPGFGEDQFTELMLARINNGLDLAGASRALSDLELEGLVSSLSWGPGMVVELELTVMNSAPNSALDYYYEIRSNSDDARPVRYEIIRESNETEVTFEITNISEFTSGQYTVTALVFDRYRRSSNEFNATVEVANSEPSSEAVPAVKDTTLRAQEPHRNEGANPRLTLEKIQGKATRSAVAFELSNIDLNGLSSANLVLTIDPGEHVNGWGNGRTVSAQALNSPWLEGNGKSLGLKKKDQVTGSGTGATWFSPSDEDISNDSANSAVHWNGAETSASPPTSPAVQIVNFQSGEVTFDVTADVLNGAEHGWLILKDQENVGSKVSFYSREGAAAAGNPDLAPRLLLEFDQVAFNSSGTQSETLLSRIGFGSIGTKLRPVSGSEVRSVKQLLQENQVAALAVEQLVSQATLANPVANWTTRLAYRSWVSESMQIAANLEMARS